MSVSINAISSIPGTGNQVAATDGLAIAIGSTAQRLLGVRGAIRLNSTTNNFEATPDGITYVTFASATGPILSITGTALQIDVTAGPNPVISIDPGYVGQASITTLGTITTGTWAGTNIGLNHGGTNAALVASNGGIFYSTATAGAILAGTATAQQLLLSGSSTTPQWSTTTYPLTNAINTLLYASAANVMSALATANNGLLVTGNTGIPSILAGPGTTGQILQANTAAAPSFSSASYPSAAALGDTLYGSATNVISALAGNITAVKQYLSQTGTGVVSAAPAWATISGGDITGAALTSGNDTNVTLTLGGTPATSLLRAASITAGWTGQLSLTRGGTNASLTASNGGIVWSNASQLQILSGTATAGQMIQSGATATPAWSTSTYPATNAINTLLYASAANVMSALATANNGVLVTSAGGVPSISTTIPSATIIASNLVKTVKTQVFTATGAGTYTPSTGMVYCQIIAVGGGGGGGGVSNAGAVAILASGGGGGGTSIGVFSAATIGGSQAINVGAGGTAGGNTGTNGGNGGNSTVGALLAGNGGTGGTGSTTNSATATVSAAGGAGGTASGGDFSFAGGQGFKGFCVGVASNGQFYGGSGGASHLGGVTQGGTGSAAGTNAVNYGNGGAGATDASSTGRVGGTGAQGIIYVIEYCNQ